MARAKKGKRDQPECGTEGKPKEEGKGSTDRCCSLLPLLPEVEHRGLLCQMLTPGGGVLPGAITIPTTPGGEGNPNLSKGVAPAGGWQPATRLSIGQRPKTCTARE